MAKDYVDSILDAAAMASRADTLDGMLNQLPGLLMEQEQQKRAEETEAERYNEQMDLQRQARLDNINRQEEAADYQFLNVAASVDDPIQTAAMLENYIPKTDRGRMGFDSLSASNAVVTGLDSNINASMKELNAEKANLSSEEYNARVLELENEINKSTYLQNKYKTGLKSYKNHGLVLSGREVATELLETRLFTGTEEEKKDFQDIIKISQTPIKQIEAIIEKFDKDKMTDKERATIISDLGNTAAQYENAGDTEQSAIISSFVNKLISESHGSTSPKVDNVNTFGLNNDEISAFRKAGKPDFFTIPAESSRPGQVIDVDLLNGTTNYRDAKPGEDLTLKAIEPTLKQQKEELDEYRLLFNNAKTQEERIKYKNLIKESKKKIKDKQESEKTYVQKRKESFGTRSGNFKSVGIGFNTGMRFNTGMSILERITRP